MADKLCKRCGRKFSGSLEYCDRCNRQVLFSLLEEQSSSKEKKSSGCLVPLLSCMVFATGIVIIIALIIFAAGVDGTAIFSYIFAAPNQNIYKPTFPPTVKSEQISIREEEEIKKFVINWKEAYENCSKNLLSFYTEGTESHGEIRSLLLDLQPSTISLNYEAIEKLSESFALVKLNINSSCQGMIKDGNLVLKLQKPVGYSWKIFEISSEPPDLLIYTQDKIVPADTPVPTAVPEDAFKYEIKEKLLPYEEWEEEYKEYFQRHYHDHSLSLKPEAIVLHYTAVDSLEKTLNIFTDGKEYADGDVGYVFGHLSVHYIIDKDGTIYHTFPLDRRCRGAYGVNHVAISIEMIALDEEQLLSRKELVSASFKLVKYLMKKFDIPKKNVWGHYHVSDGTYSETTVKDYYLDYGDTYYPNYYPDSDVRYDPGKNYMRKLYDYLTKEGF